MVIESRWEKATTSPRCASQSRSHLVEGVHFQAPNIGVYSRFVSSRDRRSQGCSGTLAAPSLRRIVRPHAAQHSTAIPSCCCPHMRTRVDPFLQPLTARTRGEYSPNAIPKTGAFRPSHAGTPLSVMLFAELQV